MGQRDSSLMVTAAAGGKRICITGLAAGHDDAHCMGEYTMQAGLKGGNDSPAISPPPYCTEFEYGDFLAPEPRRQYVVVLRNGPLRGRCYYLTGLYLLFICPTCLVIALELQ